MYMYVCITCMLVLYICLYHVGSILAGQAFCVPTSFDKINNLILCNLISIKIVSLSATVRATVRIAKCMLVQEHNKQHIKF